MPTIWNEDQVTLPRLAEHLEDAGLIKVTLGSDYIGLHSPNGLYHVVLIDHERKYLRIRMTLPLDKCRSRFDKLELIQRYSFQLILSRFSLDNDDDLRVENDISFENGLIISQFMKLLNRFALLCLFLVEDDNEDGLICLEEAATQNEDADPLQLDESIPKNVVLN